MSTLNELTNKYFKNNKRFADVVNYLIFGGEPIIKAEELYDRDTTEILVLPQKRKKYSTSQKHRDVIKGWAKAGCGETLIALIGIENQSEIHYAMPVRCHVYDAMNYSAQVEAIAERNKEKKTNDSGENGPRATPAEFLSGMRKEDRLIPVITIVIYFGEELWDGAKSLHELLQFDNPQMRDFVPDYKMNLLDLSQPADYSGLTTEVRILFRVMAAGTKGRN